MQPHVTGMFCEILIFPCLIDIAKFSCFGSQHHCCSHQTGSSVQINFVVGIVSAGTDNHFGDFQFHTSIIGYLEGRSSEQGHEIKIDFVYTFVRSIDKLVSQPFLVVFDGLHLEIVACCRVIVLLYRVYAPSDKTTMGELLVVREVKEIVTLANCRILRCVPCSHTVLCSTYKRIIGMYIICKLVVIDTVCQFVPCIHQ